MISFAKWGLTLHESVNILVISINLGILTKFYNVLNQFIQEIT